MRVSYRRLAELAGVPGRYKHAVLTPRVSWDVRAEAELTEPHGAGRNVVQNLRNFWARV